MENVISKRQKESTHERKDNIVVPIRPDMTLEEVFKIRPFARKKHEEAVAMLAKYPIPKELLL
ncbi:hypothetical protein [Chitinophaga ginsengisoli]|uniref:Uncharacterized protein n=1 Tax=Chitinophaga ginsengisoli TaxID=363837 RepID=A0A2P8FTG6_9BACT|nr:hypothetical protein [Chitinophaga ginsengisoli]PSL25014.1 hypothetical protein CLV42_114163 [Chitinophaga ginsengisoli]